MVCSEWEKTSSETHEECWACATWLWMALRRRHTERQLSYHRRERPPKTLTEWKSKQTTNCIQLCGLNISRMNFNTIWITIYVTTINVLTHPTSSVSCPRKEFPHGLCVRLCSVDRVISYCINNQFLLSNKPQLTHMKICWLQQTTTPHKLHILAHHTCYTNICTHSACVCVWLQFLQQRLL